MRLLTPSAECCVHFDHMQFWTDIPGNTQGQKLIWYYLDEYAKEFQINAFGDTL